MIGHSSANGFIVSYLINNTLKVDTFISVSGYNFYLDIDQEVYKINRALYNITNEQIKTFPKYAQKRFAFVSDNDPYLSREVLIDFAIQINVKVEEIKGGGHFNTVAGFAKFPQLLSLLNENDEKK